LLHACTVPLQAAAANNNNDYSNKNDNDNDNDNDNGASDQINPKSIGWTLSLTAAS